MLIGGNHLANALIALRVMPSDYRYANYDDVLGACGQPATDMWVAWKAAMDLRDCAESAELPESGLVDAWKERALELTKYVEHKDGCAAWPKFTSHFTQAVVSGACTCGLHKALVNVLSPLAREAGCVNEVPTQPDGESK